jgi:hypothetical protein
MCGASGRWCTSVLLLWRFDLEGFVQMGSERRRVRNRTAVVATAMALLAVPLVAHSAELGMLASLAKGEWTLRVRDDGSQQRICVRDGKELIQIRHKQSGCSRFVSTDEPEAVVVQYTCPGNGYGRTSIRREASGLVQIRTQGIHEGTPFSFQAEARHSGSC